MKPKRHLFFSAELCTGCRLCELVCSQVNNGEYNPDRAIIHILCHPDLGSNLVSIHKKPCVCGERAEVCTQICNVKAIMFVDDQDTPRMLKDKEWLAAPVFE
jgi:Fe-S-cluster-containing hydrogenase component 2